MHVLTEIGQWSGYALWALLLVTASLFVYLGLGGTFIVLGLALVHALVTGFDPIGWRLLAVLAGLAVTGEIIEFLVGTFWVAKKGATRHGVIGAFAGGLLGAALGNGVVPVVGAVLGSFVGAFGGAVLGEYIARERLEPSLRVGGQAFLGRLAAMVIKHLISLVMVGLILRATLP
ncbi:MAG TPA: DUF456 domain-containing protein [Candidatus Krumholzibacteria bacterium]|nr:DUF456 domain-containing protein [Candidatus Krumholzibacteria bacterium]